MKWIVCLLLVLVLLTGCEELKELYGLDSPEEPIRYIPVEEIDLSGVPDDTIRTRIKYCNSKNMSLGEQSDGGFTCKPDDYELEEIPKDKSDDFVVKEVELVEGEEEEGDDEGIPWLLVGVILFMFFMMIASITTIVVGRGGRRKDDDIKNQIKGDYYY